ASSSTSTGGVLYVRTVFRPAAAITAKSWHTRSELVNASPSRRAARLPYVTPRIRKGRPRKPRCLPPGTTRWDRCRSLSDGPVRRWSDGRAIGAKVVAMDRPFAPFIVTGRTRGGRGIPDPRPGLVRAADRPQLSAADRKPRSLSRKRATLCFLAASTV